ncbi:unnamed protein product [Peronospora belbahrii]|uniref:Uncharacterized protein n=1 Tax=Peronospora belbahrii TaxID=622444 RepID=A0ABN8D5G8_9STRA|nr:unnamed protein product [Peronospora belbahrii]
MPDPPPESGRDETGDDLGRPALPSAPVATRVSPTSPQHHLSEDLAARPGPRSCPFRQGATAFTPSGAEGVSRGDRLEPWDQFSSGSAGVTSEWPKTPLVTDYNDLHAALEDKMQAHLGEGPLDSWLLSTQAMYTRESDKFAV